MKAFVLLLPALLAVAPADSIERRDPGDKSDGEREQVRLREEWFWGSRSAGVASREEAAALRWQGVLETRAALQAAGRHESAGVDAADNVWQEMGPSPSAFGGWAFGDIAGRVSALTADWVNEIYYVGTASGGVWKSSDLGASWAPIFDEAGTMTIGAVEVDPNDPNTLWVGTGENNQGCGSYFGIGLMRSTDGGSNWETRNGTDPNSLEELSSFADVVVDPRDSSYLVTGGRIKGCSNGGSSSSGGIYTSNDAGLTWTKRFSGAVYEIQQDPNVLNIFWAATSSGVYKSLDDGQTWTVQTASGLPNGSTGRTELAIAPSDSNVVYALFQSGGSGAAFWRTTDGGASWAEMSTGSNACDGQCSYNSVLRVHVGNPDIVYRGNIRVWESTDGGATWTDLSNSWGSSQKVHQDTHVLLMDPNLGSTFWVGSDGGLWRTDDGGANFGNRCGNLNITQFYAIGVHAADTGIICGGAQDNSSLARDGTTGNKWELQVATGDGFVCHFNNVDTDYVYASSYPNFGPAVYRSSTGLWGSYSRVTGFGSGINVFDRVNWVTPYLLDPSNPSTLYLGTHRMYRSDDHGSNWNPIGPSDMTGGSGNLRALEINRNHPDVLYAGSTNGKIWRTTDGGLIWTEISAGLPSRQISDIAADPNDPDRALATVTGFNTDHLWEWTAASGVWTGIDGGLPNVPANTVLFRDSSDVYVGVDTGVFRSTDGGQTLTPYMLGLPEGTVVTDLKYSETPDRITLGSYGRGAWQVDVGAASAGDPGSVPATIALAKIGGEIEATWGASCNAGAVPGQAYSIQAGDLDALHASGTYGHAAIGGDCARTSPATFTPGAGSEYYLIVPNVAGLEGGAGVDSLGVSRPQTDATCGIQQVAACP